MKRKQRTGEQEEIRDLVHTIISKTMDSRDIKEEPGIIPDYKYLEEIYQMQKNLLSGYIGIEGLPQYPVDINTKASQTLLKDFTARVIEELSEGYESFERRLHRVYRDTQ